MLPLRTDLIRRGTEEQREFKAQKTDQVYSKRFKV